MGKNYERLTISDDFMFGKVMQDRELSKELLELLLQREVGELESVRLQEKYQFSDAGKPIFLDLLCKNKEAFFDAEMQNKNKQSVEALALPKRTRYYQALLDADFLEKRMNYFELPEGNIVMICTFDPFGEDKCVYEFENYDQKLNIALQDGTKKYFFNCSYEGEDGPEDILRFYEYVRTEKVSTDFTRRLHEAVKKARMKSEWKVEYMKELTVYMDMRNEGRSEGVSIGRKEGELKVLVGLVERGLLSSIDAAKEADMSEEEFVAILQQSR